MTIIRTLAHLMGFTGRITLQEASSSVPDLGSTADTMAGVTTVAGTMDAAITAAVTGGAAEITATAATMVAATLAATAAEMEMRFTAAVGAVTTVVGITARAVVVDRTAVDMVAVDAGKAK
jgi:hypothetical protein